MNISFYITKIPSSESSGSLKTGVGFNNLASSSCKSAMLMVYCLFLYIPTDAWFWVGLFIDKNSQEPIITAKNRQEAFFFFFFTCNKMSLKPTSFNIVHINNVFCLV